MRRTIVLNVTVGIQHIFQILLYRLRMRKQTTVQQFELSMNVVTEVTMIRIVRLLLFPPHMLLCYLMSALGSGISYFAQYQHFGSYTNSWNKCNEQGRCVVLRSLPCTCQWPSRFKLHQGSNEYLGLKLHLENKIDTGKNFARESRFCLSHLNGWPGEGTQQQETRKAAVTAADSRHCRRHDGGAFRLLALEVIT